MFRKVAPSPHVFGMSQGVDDGTPAPRTVSRITDVLFFSMKDQAEPVVALEEELVLGMTGSTRECVEAAVQECMRRKSWQNATDGFHGIMRVFEGAHATVPLHLVPETSAVVRG